MLHQQQEFTSQQFYLQINKTVKLGSTWISLNNRADPEIIEQLGGITKTIDSMTQTLREHELRPYEFWTVHQEPLISKQYEKARLIEHNLYGQEDDVNIMQGKGWPKTNKSLGKQRFNTAWERKIVSWSPFRAFCSSQ